MAEQLHSSHMLAKYCQKFFKPGFYSMWTVNFQMYKLDLEKTEEPEIKFPTSTGSLIKQENSRKTSTSALLTMLRLWLCGLQQTGKFFKRWEYQTTWPASWEICMHVRKQQLKLDMEQCWGPASAESRDILRMDDVGEWRKIDKEIKKETTRGDQASLGEAPLLYSSWGFYTLSYTYSNSTFHQ